MRQAVRRADQPDELAHDLGDPKSFGVKTAATPSSRSAARVGLGDDPADDDRHVARARRPQTVQHVGHQLQVRAGQHRQPDQVHVLGHRGRDDLAGVSRIPW